MYLSKVNFRSIGSEMNEKYQRGKDQLLPSFSLHSPHILSMLLWRFHWLLFRLYTHASQIPFSRLNDDDSRGQSCGFRRACCSLSLWMVSPPFFKNKHWKQASYSSNYLCLYSINIIGLLLVYKILAYPLVKMFISMLYVCKLFSSFLS